MLTVLRSSSPPAISLCQGQVDQVQEPRDIRLAIISPEAMVMAQDGATGDGLIKAHLEDGLGVLLPSRRPGALRLPGADRDPSQVSQVVRY